MQTKEKPVVFFDGPADYRMLNDTEFAFVYALNHPKWGKEYLRTSKIVKHLDDGFETLNTIYRRNIEDR